LSRPADIAASRTAPGGDTEWGQLYIVAFASFVVWAGFGAILPYLPVFLKEEAHASVLFIGVIAAGYYVGTFVFSTPLGRLSDSIGRKPVIVAGVVLYAVATLLFVSTTHPGWFLLFRLLEGIGAAAVGPAGQAFIADITTDENRSRAYGWLTTAQFGGLVAGPALAWPLYSLGGGEGKWAFYSIFLFGSAVSAVMALLLLIKLKEPERSRRRRREKVQRPALRTLLNRPILAFILVAATGHFAMGTWDVIWSLYLRHLGASMAFVGWTWIAFSVPMLLSFVGGYIADRGNRFLLMFSGYAISGVAWVIYGTVTALWVLLLFNVVEGIAIAYSYPAKQAFLVQVSPRRWLGTIQGLEGTSMQLAALIGTLLSPLLYSVIGGWVIALGGFLSLAGLAVAAPILHRAWQEIKQSGSVLTTAEAEKLAYEHPREQFAAPEPRAE
jgi:DHA1 family multidrug resistance protein-like MFS transporter